MKSVMYNAHSQGTTLSMLWLLLLLSLLFLANHAKGLFKAEATGGACVNHSAH